MSDDLIEIEGDMTKEFDHYSSNSIYLHLDDTVLECQHCPNDYILGWSIRVVKLGKYVNSAIETLYKPYKDEDVWARKVDIVSEKEIKKVFLSKEMNGPTNEEILDRLENFDFSSVDPDILQKINEFIS